MLMRTRICLQRVTRGIFRMLGLLLWPGLCAGLLAQATPEIVFPYSSGIQLKNEDMSAAALDKAQASGVKFVRKGIYWDTIEPTAGNYNWTQTDAWINSMESRGFSMVITIVWNNRIYEDIWDRAIVTEPGRQAFARFAADLVRRYQGKPIIWEIWNEPNLRSFWHENEQNVSNTDAMAEEYTALVKVAAPAMKAADPNCRIAACSISALWSASFSWFERCVETGVLTSGIDAISVHPYGFRWPELAMAEGYPVIRQILDSNNAADMPIITSEVGYPESWLLERGVTAPEVENVQAWQFVRQNLVDAMAGVQVSIWYELTDAAYGVLNTDLSNRPTFTAAQVMTAQLSGYHFKERIPLASALDYAVVFENAEGEQKLVAWTTPDRTKPVLQQVEVPHSVALPVGSAGTYNVVNVFGTVTALSTSTETLTVTLTGGPQYIPLPTPVAVYANVALGKPATISSGTGVTKLTDGLLNTNSRWMADYGFPQWAEIDLQGLFLIDKVTFLQHAERVDGYQVQVWNGSVWTTVATAASNSALNIEASFSPVVASKVRFTVTAGSLYLKVFELEVYGEQYVPPPYVNVALGKPATVSSGSGAMNLTDGLLNTNSRWMADYGFPQWAEIDLQGSHTIDKVILKQHAERTDAYQVQVWNGSVWTTVASATSNTAMNVEVNFSPVVAGKVRFTISSGSLYLKVFELEVYGSEDP